MGSNPTEILKDGTKVWRNENGQFHREDGPAVIYPNGDKFWCINDQYHREDGPAIIYENGTQIWWINGKLNREDGPAIIYFDGPKEWWVNGKRHRLDGPAIDTYWYIHDNDVTKQITKWAKERDIDLNNLTDEDKMIIQLEWGNYGK